jgi:hypothetical protein
MQEWEYISLDSRYISPTDWDVSSGDRRSSLSFTPAKKVTLDDLKTFLADWPSMTFELDRQHGQLLVLMPNNFLDAARVAACDFLGRAGWEAYSSSDFGQGSGRTDFKRLQLEKS